MGAQLNLKFHTGQDHYSDGSVEDEILNIVKENKEFDSVLNTDYRWPILYHLSPIRKNILNWYPFKKNASLLEIGGGCGAITGSFCEKVSTVKVVELSQRRAQINYERHKSFNHLEILVGNLNDIKIEEQFDYITLIGVLEYAGSFTHTQEPYKDFLLNIKKYLKPNGKLFIAIENRYGLKYFAGAKEDHTAQEFDGITGYIDNNTVKTFGKKELQELLSVSGYNTQEFYYPHPDYKMPLEIYSQYHLPQSFNSMQKSPNFDNDRFVLFDEEVAFKGIIENEQYEFFANSFLVICGD